MTDNVLRGNASADAASAADPLTRRVDDGPSRIGRAGTARARVGIFPYDRIEGAKSTEYTVSADMADTMPKADVLRAWQAIHRANGVSREMESVLKAHDDALLLCHAFNGASQIGPHGRSHYSFKSKDTGVKSSFLYASVFEILGVDFRRFFRTLADAELDVCRQLYFHCNHDDPEQVEDRLLMIRLSDKRGTHRYPYIIGDSAEHALYLDAGERAAAFGLQAHNVANTVNAVDQRNMAKPVRSLNNYDSSLGESVSNDNDVHAGVKYYN